MKEGEMTCWLPNRVSSGNVKRSKYNGWERNYSSQIYRNDEGWAVTGILIKHVCFCDSTYGQVRNSSSLQFSHLVGDQAKSSGCLQQTFILRTDVLPWQLVKWTDHSLLRLLCYRPPGGGICDCLEADLKTEAHWWVSENLPDSLN